MRDELIEKYAHLIAKVGARIEKGEEVWINAELDQPDFVTMVVEECYKLGAKRVEVRWSYEKAQKLGYKYMTAGELGRVRPFDKGRMAYWAKKNPTVIHIISDDPDGLKGVNQKKLAKAKMKSYKVMKPYRDAMEDNYKWVIAAVPSKAWAKKVFPKLPVDEAVNALWDAILKTSRVDENDPVQNWEKHNNFLHTQMNKLNALNLYKLHYKASNGTDFHVELINEGLWDGGYGYLHDGRPYNPNIPTEEVFTSPFRGRCEGTLVATKPLSYNGELIEDFSFDFKDGKVVACHARKNQKLLEQMVKMDEGACMLGEVALVPFESPINELGFLFYNTLFDENACCHVALGTGFPMTLKDSEGLSTEELIKRGVNNSMIHVDFMIGSRDLSIVGEKHDGQMVQIFKDGTWAI